MRFVFIPLIVSLLLAGCASRKAAAKGAADSAAATAEAKPQKRSDDKAKAPPGKPKVTKIEISGGEVSRVDKRLRFVVIDFSVNPLPALDQQMSVYRDNRKVGEVKITGPSRESNIAADIIAGDAEVGDEVRPN